MAAGRRHRLQRGGSGGPVHTTRLRLLDRVRHGPHAGRAGSVEGLEVAVLDVEAAREELIGHGVDVSEVFHRGEAGFEPGPDPERRSYFSFASFSDPDGNGWLLQEISERLPGR